VEPVETIEPSEVVTPSPEPTEPLPAITEPEILPEIPVEPENQLIQGIEEAVSAIQDAVVETFELAAEAVAQVLETFQVAGLDMTTEERKQAQSVVIPSVLVAQVATITFRK
jgi:hypothetical protein